MKMGGTVYGMGLLCIMADCCKKHDRMHRKWHASQHRKPLQGLEAEMYEAFVKEPVDLERLEQLLNAGVDPDLHNPCAKATLLGLATDEKSDAVRLLIKKGANPNARRNGGLTPLHWAVSGADADDESTEDSKATIVGLLLDAGARVNDAANKQGWTPLHLAAGYKNERFVKLLVARGADVNAQDKAGRTPLHFAIAYHHDAIAQALLAAGADPHLQDNDGYTPTDNRPLPRELQAEDERN